MNWFERFFTTFGLIMIAFSAGCVVRGEGIGLLHGICVIVHGTVIFAYVEMYLKRRHSRGVPQ